MANRLMREGLRHTHSGLKDEAFFQMIDKTGGWPVGYKFVGFVHSDERAAGFCNSSLDDGWWTVLYHADDYYTWKLTPEGVNRIAQAVIDRIAGLVRTAGVSSITVRGWRGYLSTITTKGPA